MTNTRKEYKGGTAAFFRFINKPEDERTVALAMDMMRATRPRSLMTKARLHHVPDRILEHVKTICILEGIIKTEDNEK